MGRLSWIIQVGPNVIIQVLTREGHVMMETEIEMMHFEDGERGHKLWDTSSL